MPVSQTETLANTRRQYWLETILTGGNLSNDDLYQAFLQNKTARTDLSISDMEKIYWAGLANKAVDLSARPDTTLRTNWVTSPNQVNPSPGYGSQTLTSVTGIVGHPAGITTATRVSFDNSTTNSNPGIVIGAPIQDGHTYTISAWVYLETATDGQPAFAQQGIGSSTVTLTQGSWVRVYATRVAVGSNNYGFRFSGQTTLGNSYLITGVDLEESPVMLPLFDPNAPSVGETVNRWTGAVEASYNQTYQTHLSIADYESFVFAPYQGEELYWLRAQP